MTFVTLCRWTVRVKSKKKDLACGPIVVDGRRSCLWTYCGRWSRIEFLTNAKHRRHVWLCLHLLGVSSQYLFTQGPAFEICSKTVISIISMQQCTARCTEYFSIFNEILIGHNSASRGARRGLKEEKSSKFNSRNNETIKSSPALKVCWKMGTFD